MDRDSVTPNDLDSRLQQLQDRLLTAIFGFVNGASSRMEALEDHDRQLRSKIQALERRMETLEKRQ